MTPKLRISSNVLKRLQELTSKDTGRLFGVMSENSLTVLSFALNPPEDEESSIPPAALQLNMPVEIDLCGVLFIGEASEKIPEAFKDIDITDNPLLLRYTLGAQQVQSFVYIHQTLKPAGEPEVIDESEIWERFFYIRLRTSIPMTTQRSEIIDAFQTTRKNLASGSVGFHFPEIDVYLLGSDSESKVISIKDLMGNPRRNFPGAVEAIDALMLTRMTDEKSEGSLKYAPVLQHVKRPFQSLQFDINVDTLSIVEGSVNATRLYSILVESVCRNLRLIERSFTHELNQEKLKVPEVLHFKPRNCMHLVTVAYPRGSSDEDTRDYRKNLHKVLSFDLSKPLFCRGNAVRFSNDFTSYEPILNPHAAVTSLGSGFSVSLVKGLYAYHHYMQDKFDDSGWGCAYRSLQTIFSWFRLQGYTGESIPSHRAIQKCLVDIGDKSHNFIGSQQWIGSTEVGFVLETLLGISVRVLCAATGGQMQEQIISLKEHFQYQGTPVMIGGGVLAHTILGVAHNEETDEIKFLILDPHYTGPEDLKTITNKGWCGWKGLNFWKKDAFYNMCLPQIPSRY
ncbi:ufm1-specific protease 2 [Fopius arisanus]|uniref:Probable Ufm1-specific protease 2 n=1 Tax=Fopius arisanus TaxID=64838 RepID=A0A0C9R9H8_9HYME|nr:PREDICTED: ufm1-specific protease 2 [Fopius arisanus]